MPPDPPGLAIHIGADVLTSPRHAHWPAVRSCRDTLQRTTRLAAAAGITRQLELLGARASRAEVTGALRQAAAELDPDGHLLLAFTGHSDRERTTRTARPTSAGACTTERSRSLRSPPCCPPRRPPRSSPS